MFNAGFYAMLAALDFAIAVHTLWHGGGGWAYWAIGFAGAFMAQFAVEDWKRKSAPKAGQRC